MERGNYKYEEEHYGREKIMGWEWIKKWTRMSLSLLWFHCAYFSGTSSYLFFTVAWVLDLTIAFPKNFFKSVNSQNIWSGGRDERWGLGLRSLRWGRYVGGGIKAEHSRWPKASSVWLTCPQISKQKTRQWGRGIMMYCSGLPDPSCSNLPKNPIVNLCLANCDCHTEMTQPTHRLAYLHKEHPFQLFPSPHTLAGHLHTHMFLCSPRIELKEAMYFGEKEKGFVQSLLCGDGGPHIPQFAILLCTGW